VTNAALRFEDVSFAYAAGRPVLRDVSAELRAGVTAVLGPNGAGKSTLLKVAMGALSPATGRVMLGGSALSSTPARERAQRLAYIAQRPVLGPAVTVREATALGRVRIGPSRAAVERALQTMRLGELADRACGALSEGQRARVSMARALAQLGGAEDARPLDGCVVLADEPFAALDPAFAALTAGVLRDLADAGAAVVVVLHDPAVAARLADRALLLDGAGRLAFDGPAAEGLTVDRLGALFGASFAAAEVEGVAAPIARLGHAGGADASA
jgi:iron complex transport system ATP-binding protein